MSEHYRNSLRWCIGLHRSLLSWPQKRPGCQRTGLRSPVTGTHKAPVTAHWKTRDHERAVKHTASLWAGGQKRFPWRGDFDVLAPCVPPLRFPSSKRQLVASRHDEAGSEHAPADQHKCEHIATVSLEGALAKDPVSTGVYAAVQDPERFTSTEHTQRAPASPSGTSRKRPRNMTPYRPVRSEVDYRALVDDELPRIVKGLGLGPTAVLALDPQHPGPTEQAKNAYLSWLTAGYHGSMEYMARTDRIQRALNYEQILPGVRAIVVTTLFYWPGKSGFTAPADAATPNRGTVSCYAWGQDYHRTLGQKLKQLAEEIHAYAGGQGRYYVDTGALLERHIGESAGLGFVGKNSLLIHPQLGSGFFLGEVLTTLPLPSKRPDLSGRGGCGRCRKCRTACPTGAIVEDRVVDARRCISYLTIELKDAIPEEYREAIGSLIYGCDICQQVCPWNQFDWEGSPTSPLFGEVPQDVREPDLLALLDLNEVSFQERFRDSPIRRIGLERLQRNVLVALGNVGNPHQSRARLVRFLEENESELLREHARWALDRIERREKAAAPFAG